MDIQSKYIQNHEYHILQELEWELQAKRSKVYPLRVMNLIESQISNRNR
jgi:hypothetical protein